MLGTGPEPGTVQVHIWNVHHSTISAVVNAFQNIYVLVYQNDKNFQMRKIFISNQDWHYAGCFIYIFSDIIAKENKKFRIHMSDGSLVS